MSPLPEHDQARRPHGGTETNLSSPIIAASQSQPSTVRQPNDEDASVERELSALLEQSANLGLDEQILMRSIQIANRFPYRFRSAAERAMMLDPTSHARLFIEKVDKLLEDVIKQPKILDSILQGEHKKASKLIEEDIRQWVMPRVQVTSHNKSYVLYPPIQPGWDNIDKLMPSKEADDNNRYRALYHNRNNSCATDVLIGLAIHLDAWRIVADQYIRVRVPNLAVHWLRNVARTPWGMLDDEKREELRNQLVRTIAAADSSLPKAGQFRDVVETYGLLFKSLPQVSSHSIKMSWCCDKTNAVWFEVLEKNLWSRHGKAESGQPQTLASVLQNVFREHTLPGIPENCSLGTPTTDQQCSNVTTQTIICGRLSPVIVIDACSSFNKISLEDPGVITLHYHCLDANDLKAGVPVPKECTARYSVEAVIYFAEAHFVIESNLQRRRLGMKVHMDMIARQPDQRFRASKCSSDSWHLRGSWEPSLLVYKLVAADNEAST